MSRLIRKSHNKSVLIYHFVIPTKYRRVVFDPEVDEVLKEVCIEIADRYQIEFLGIGTDGDHVHFLVQSVPRYSVTKNYHNDQKSNSPANISTSTLSQETIVGRRILDGWITLDQP